MNTPDSRDFPGGPVVKTLASNAGVQAQSLFGELGSHILCGQKAKMLNRSSIVTNSIKTLKMVHMKEKYF